MTKLFIVPVIVGLFLIGVNCAHDYPDETIGKIKTYSTTYYSCSVRLGKLEKGEISSIYFYRYDDRGNEIEFACNIHGVLPSLDIFKYDDNDNMIEQSIYDSEGSLDWKYIFKYDDKGNNIENGCYLADGSLEWEYLSEYDDKGNKIEDAKYDSEGELLSKRLYIYDVKIKEIESFPDHSEGEMVGLNIFQNEKGNSRVYKDYDHEGRPFGAHPLYDTAGNLLDIEFYQFGVKYVCPGS